MNILNTHCGSCQGKEVAIARYANAPADIAGSRAGTAVAKVGRFNGAA
jgi:hypothetical protein